MISKKVAAALGAGAMGAAGAGTLGAKLFSKEKIKLSESDERIIASTNLSWSENVTQGQVKAIINDGKITWECGLHPIAVGFGSGESYQTEEQWKKIKKEMDGDATKKRNFVKNCAESRTAEEKKSGNKSTILLVAEKTGKIWKFKDFEKILTEDFMGLERMEGENLKVYQSTNWETKEETTKEGKTKKITVTATLSNNKKWSCSISGKYSSDLNSDTFKEDGLKEILKTSQDPNISEKKKYLIRNCSKHKKDIKGLTVQGTSDGKWEFSDLKKITEGMYENPVQAKTNLG